jgi:hypothetical protein
VSNLRDIFNSLITSRFKEEEIYSLKGTISNVRESKLLCDFTPQVGAKILDVSLNIVESNTFGVLKIPENGVQGIVTFFNNEEAFLLDAEKLSKILIKIDTSTLEINNSKFIFNGGGKDGLVNVNDLVTKLNNLESKVNTIISTFNAHVHPASGVISPTPIVGSLTPTNKSDIEDTNITH